MTTATKSINAALYMVTGATEVTKIAQVKSVSGIGGAGSDIDVSHFESEDDEFVGGRNQTSDITAEVVWDVTAHAKVEEYYASKAATQFMLVAPNASGEVATAPTASSSAFAAYTTATNVKWSGYIKDFALSVGDNSAWSGSITIKRSGVRTVTAAA